VFVSARKGCSLVHLSTPRSLAHASLVHTSRVHTRVCNAATDRCTSTDPSQTPQRLHHGSQSGRTPRLRDAVATSSRYTVHPSSICSASPQYCTISSILFQNVRPEQSRAFYDWVSGSPVQLLILCLSVCALGIPQCSC
jgi:hypothetical protein